MVENLHIKIAAYEGLEEILNLILQQFDEHQIFVAEHVLRAGIAEMLKDQRLGVVLTAHQGETVVGCAVLAFAWTLEHGGRSAWLDELYVCPNFRGKGIGKALVEATTRKALELNCKAIDLEVDEGHNRVESLYQRLGFMRLSRSRWVKHLG